MLIVKCILRKETDRLPDKHSFLHSFALLLTIRIFSLGSVALCLTAHRIAFNHLSLSAIPTISLHGAHTHTDTLNQEETLALVLKC